MVKRMTNEEKKNVELVKFDTPYTDAISRQAAIDAMREETCLSCWDAKDILAHLPSVSTEKLDKAKSEIRFGENKAYNADFTMGCEYAISVIERMFEEVER